MQAAYGKRQDGEWIEDAGYVSRIIPDDHHGARHQRFIVEVRGGQSLLIAHNMDIAKRVPVGVGDRVGFRGIYEYNDLGGVVHWTHRDPHGGEDHGWIRFRKQDYD